MSSSEIPNFFKTELLNPQTKYFILDASGEPHSHEDIDFIKYGYSTRQFNKVNVGDLFLYRRPNRGSHNGRFYFFGAGKVNTINQVIKKNETLNAVDVSIEVGKPLPFFDYVYAEDIDDYEWEWKKRKNTWSYFFNQYGMNEIPKNDFLAILRFGFYKQTSVIAEDVEIEVYLTEKFQNEDYFVPDQYHNIKTRGQAQKVFSKKLKEIYNNTCCITGISKKGLLSASHIIPWSQNKEIRLDPQNGLLLSPLMDKLFDQNLISLDEKYQIVFSDELKSDIVLYSMIKQYECKKIKLPKNKNYWPDLQYLQVHRDIFFLSKPFTTQRKFIKSP